MTLPDVAETRRLLTAGHTTAGELVHLALRAIEEKDPELGAFVSVGADSALRQAAAADDLIRSEGPGAWREHPLLGVTVAVKDLVQTGDLPTTRGSLLPNHRPAIDAPAVARLRAAGAIVLGKTTTSEYGWSGSTVSRVAPPTRNPWDPDRTSGGSSGGSAAAVAAGLCTVALGTDGAGSIRIPAAFCGVVGYKPTFGLVPYVPPCADLLAHLGPIGRTVADVAAVADVMAGADVRDPDSLAVASHPVKRTRGLRVAWLEAPGTTAPVRAASERLAAALDDLGHDVRRVERPFEDPYGALADLLAAGEAAGFSEADTELGDPGRLALARYGAALPAAAVGRAMEARLELRVRMAGLMEQYDLLALATVPVEPFAFDAVGPAPFSPAPDWLAWAAGTYPFNLTGQPAVSVPVGLTTTGLPAGGQIVGAVGHDRLVLAVAEQVQRHLPPLPDLPRTATKG